MGFTQLNKKELGKLNGVEIPTYDLNNRRCQILHIGVGNFHRAHQAYYLHDLLQQEDSPWRICGAGLMPQDEHMKKALSGQDYMYTLVSQKSDSEDIRIIGSIRNYIHICTEYSRFIEVFTDDVLKIISLTVTEKGYCNTNDWNLDVEYEGIQHDLHNENAIPKTAIGVLAYGIKLRMLAGASPLTIMSCDNIPGNGEVLKRILLQFVDQKKDADLKDYINRFVKFPSCMVDRITPGTTSDKVKYLENEYGFQDKVPVFSEDYIQWIIEDDFNVERPEWERLGVQIVEDVKPYEIMKTRLLNGGHSALAFPSLLSGFEFVDDAMENQIINKFVESYMNEVKVTLTPINGVDYDAYIQMLLTRFKNPAIKDRVQRLAEDSSSKFVNFIIPALIKLINRDEKTPMIAVVIASWIVYLNDSFSNSEYEVDDPRSEKIRNAASNSLEDCTEFLSLKEIFPDEVLNNQVFKKELNNMINDILNKGIKSVLTCIIEKL